MGKVMKKWLSFFAVFMLIITTGVAVANYGNPNLYAEVDGVGFYYGNTILTDRYSAYARTSSGLSSYNTTYAEFYSFNTYTDTYDKVTRLLAQNYTAKVEAPQLSGYNRYYKVISNHSSSYLDRTFSHNNVTTIVP